MKMWTGQAKANFDNRDARDREERAKRREGERAVRLEEERVEERRKTKRKAKKSKTGSSTPDIDMDIINSLNQSNSPQGEHPNRMLMRICQENGYKPEYVEEKRQEEWRSKVIVNESQVFYGNYCKNKKDAKRSASEVALRHLI